MENLTAIEGFTTGRARVDAIYDELRRRICTLVYQPKDTLREVELAEEFNVSRTPMRQVLQRLEFEQLAKTKRGVGTLVTDINFEELVQVYELRMKLAELMGQLSPREPTDEDLRGIEELERRCRKLAESATASEFAELNLDFNDFLMTLVGNDSLRRTMAQLFHRTARVWMSQSFDWTVETERFQQELAELGRALRDRDMVSVGFAHRNHISMSLKRIRHLVEAQPREGAQSHA